MLCVAPSSLVEIYNRPAFPSGGGAHRLPGRVALLRPGVDGAGGRFARQRGRGRREGGDSIALKKARKGPVKGPELFMQN